MKDSSSSSPSKNDLSNKQQQSSLSSILLLAILVLIPVLCLCFLYHLLPSSNKCIQQQEDNNLQGLNILLPHDTTALQIKKRYYSKRVRFLFVAGLGGTGHHGWAKLLEEGNVCQQHDGLREALVKVWWNGQTDHSGKGNHDARADQKAQKLRTAFMKAQTEALQRQNNTTVYCLNLVGKGSMFSYPDRNDMYHHPNLWSLTEIAQDAGVDLRIVVLHRHPIPQIVSLTVHRGYMESSRESRQMANQAGFLNAELAALDPAFFVCTAFTGVSDAADVLNQHLLGGMDWEGGGGNTNQSTALSRAIATYYQSHPEDPQDALKELKASRLKRNKHGKKRKPVDVTFMSVLDEMEASYKYIQALCNR